MDRERMQDLLRESRVADQVDRKRAELFEALLPSAGWKAYQELLTTLIEERGAQLLSPAGSLDGAFASEFLKGTMFGLVLARDLPSVTIAHVAAMSAKEPEDNDASQ